MIGIFLEPSAPLAHKHSLDSTIGYSSTKNGPLLAAAHSSVHVDPSSDNNNEAFNNNAPKSKSYIITL